MHLYKRWMIRNTLGVDVIRVVGIAFLLLGSQPVYCSTGVGGAFLKDARTGIITAGFVKLADSVLSIGTGIAAYYFFQQIMPGVQLDGDTAFPMLMREVVAPTCGRWIGRFGGGRIDWCHFVQCGFHDELSRHPNNFRLL